MMRSPEVVGGYFRCEYAIQLTNSQLRQPETPLLPRDVPQIEHREWLALGLILEDPRAYANADTREAALVVWTRGLVDHTQPNSLAQDRYFALLNEGLSLATRSGAFIAVSNFCERLLLEESGLRCVRPQLTEQYGAYFKLVRLMKRNGRFTDALSLLGLLASSAADASTTGDRRLNEARILLTVSKALGSHLNLLDQCHLLATLAARRVALLRSDRTAAAHTWLRAVSAAAQTEFDRRRARGLSGHSAASKTMFRQWRDAAHLDAILDNCPSREEFARTFAHALSAQTAAEVHFYERRYRELLIQLATGRLDRRGLSIRHSQYARIMLLQGRNEEAVQFARSSLEYAELVSDWQSIARSLLLQAEALVAQGSRTNAVDPRLAAELLERGRRALDRLCERPINLLLAYCRDQARQYLLIGETRRATDALEEALSYVSGLQVSLRREQANLTRRRGWHNVKQDSIWRILTTNIFSERERNNMRIAAASDWEFLLLTQRSLVDDLQTANQISHRNSIYLMSASRVTSFRAVIYHTVENAVTETFRALRRDIASQGIDDAMQRDKLLDAYASAESTLLTIFEERVRPESGRSVDAETWFPIYALVEPNETHRRQLQFYDSRLELSIQAESAFALQAEPESFREHFFNFLMNAAQQLATLPADGGPHRVAVTNEWDPERKGGVVRITDSAGRVRQLCEGLQAAHSRDAAAASKRGRQGLRHVVSFLREIWGCSLEAGGREGESSTVLILFPHAVRVRKL